MDWVYDTLTEGDKKLNEAEDTGSWDALDGLGALLDRACERTREMRSFLETHLYPRPEPENPQITCAGRDARGKIRENTGRGGS